MYGPHIGMRSTTIGISIPVSLYGSRIGGEREHLSQWVRRGRHGQSRSQFSRVKVDGIIRIPLRFAVWAALRLLPRGKRWCFPSADRELARGEAMGAG